MENNKFILLAIIIIFITFTIYSQRYKCFDGYYCENGYILSTDILYYDTNDLMYKTYLNVSDIPEGTPDLTIWNVEIKNDSIYLDVVLWEIGFESRLYFQPLDKVLSDTLIIKRCYVLENVVYSGYKADMVDGLIHKIYQRQYTGLMPVGFIESNKLERISLEESDSYLLIAKYERQLNDNILLIKIEKDLSKVDSLLKEPKLYYEEESLLD